MKISLTKAEEVARDHFLKVLRNAVNEECDDNQFEDSHMPEWFDEVAYRRGQEFFFKNKWAILQSNLIGLICLLADKRGLNILSLTGKSTTVEDARRRYISTVVHTLSWYQFDLTAESRSRKSLSTVRRMHFKASEEVKGKSAFGPIDQGSLAFTAFGFMGLPLLYPQTLGIRFNTEENRLGFVHFWAVVCHMIGIKDEYNICLLPYDSLIILCQMMIRYLFVPQLQLETQLFRDMVTSMVRGLFYTRDPNVLIYLTKMYCQVPGYQYGISRKDHRMCRPILTQNDIDDLYACWNARAFTPMIFPLSTKIPIVTISSADWNANSLSDKYVKEADIEYVKKELNLSDIYQIDVQYVEYDSECKLYWNERKFFELKFSHRMRVRFIFFLTMIYQYSLGRWIVDYVYNRMLRRYR